MELDGWLKRENLKGFLVALSEIVEYDFGQLDWGAFESGLSSGGDSGWFVYPLVGRVTVEVAVSRAVEEGDSDLKVSIPCDDPCLGKQIRVAWMIFNRFDVSPDVVLLD
ncbi:hypothetical protein ABT104_29115 [Streptomyces mobaraensis]|uniref:hypothetical protein n=1 Tax=Streptomyces mobaraensis TaxID=35621 RepID=UPI003322730A